jgi:TolB-like protein
MAIRLRHAFAGALVSSALSVRPATVEAQCPDGTPPPCGAPVRRVAARATPPNAEARRRSFLVLPFRNLSRATEHDWLVEGSPVLIADALSRNETVRVVPDERLYPALKRAGLVAGGVMDLSRVRGVAEETGGWTAVTGEILALGKDLRVSARAFDVVSNAEVLRVVETSAAGEDVRAVYQRLGTKLMAIAGAQAAAANLASTTTQSLDAYRAYVRGVTHANRSEPKRARDAFLEAVRIDSTYAQAYARLADAEMSADPRQLINPQSPLYRYSARAAQLSGNLPPRDRELVLSINDYLSGKFASARERLTRLLEQDSTNVDALEWKAGLEVFDPILVPAAGGGERPRGSLNRGLGHAKRALELDPSRHNLYGSLVQAYLIAGGGTPGIVMGYRQEMPSLAGLFNSIPVHSYYPVLRDTIVLIPTDSINSIPADSLAAARARALNAARLWAQRWLAAGQGQAEPHLWASRVHSQAGDFAAALRELEAADSLGVETGLENVPARRMSLLAQMKRYADGRRIADSLFQANALDFTTLTAYQFEGVGWAYSLFVLNGQYDRATAIVEKMAAALAPAVVANPQLPAEALATVLLTGGARQYFSPPTALRTAVYEKLLADAGTLPAGSPLTRVLPFHARVLWSDTAISRPKLAASLAAAAARLATTQPLLAYQLMVEAGSDSVQRRSLDSLAWFVTQRQQARVQRAAVQARMQPGRIVVTDSTAVFSWTVSGDSLTWNRLETAIGEDDYLWEAEFTVAGGRYEVLANVAKRPTLLPVSGRLTALLASATPQVHEVPADSTQPHRTISRTAVRLEPEAGGFRMVLRDARLVTALRRERPATVRMQFRPCITGAMLAGAKCVDQDVSVVYP